MTMGGRNDDGRARRCQWGKRHHHDGASPPVGGIDREDKGREALLDFPPATGRSRVSLKLAQARSGSNIAATILGATRRKCHRKPCSRHKSTKRMPASAWHEIPIIRSSLNRLRFIPGLLCQEHSLSNEPVFGGGVKSRTSSYTAIRMGWKNLKARKLPRSRSIQGHRLSPLP